MPNPLVDVFYNDKSRHFTIIGFCYHPVNTWYEETGETVILDHDEMRCRALDIVIASLHRFESAVPASTKPDAETRRRKMQFLRDNRLIEVELIQPDRLALKPCHRERGGHRGSEAAQRQFLSLPCSNHDFYDSLARVFTMAS